MFHFGTVGILSLASTVRGGDSLFTTLYIHIHEKHHSNDCVVQSLRTVLCTRGGQPAIMLVEEVARQTCTIRKD